MNDVQSFPFRVLNCGAVGASAPALTEVAVVIVPSTPPKKFSMFFSPKAGSCDSKSSCLGKLFDSFQLENEFAGAVSTLFWV